MRCDCLHPEIRQPEIGYLIGIFLPSFPYIDNMPETIADRSIFSLLEVTRSIQRTLADRYGSSFWVKAEMNKLNHYPHSGHCYPDLVEKKDGKVIAQLRSVLWKDDYFRINNSFLRLLKTPLKDGINMLFCARIAFDPVHGLSLRIIDIDPVFSLGELEREKTETIEKLRAAGIFDRNKSLKLEPVPQRIAIISVETSKGYADFQKVISNNDWGYKFFHFLFPSVLQGERAVESIIYQLNRIRKVISHFDAVAIIRGGGGEVGLSCFNDHSLAREIALFPLPVITGIGHATNETVVEMIAYKNAITPTDLANYLLDAFHEFAGPVRQAEEKLVDHAKRILLGENIAFSNTVRYFRSVTDNLLMRNRHGILSSSHAMAQHSRFLVRREKEGQHALLYEIRKNTLSFCSGHQLNLRQLIVVLTKDLANGLKSKNSDLEALQRSVSNMRPENVMKRGYSITRVNGKAVRSYGDVKRHDQLTTFLSDGKIESEVVSIQKKENDDD